MNYGCCVQPNLGMVFPLLGITAVHQESAGKLLCAFLGEGTERFVGAKESPELQTAGKDAFSYFSPRTSLVGNTGYPLRLPRGFGEPGIARARQGEMV